MAEKDKTPVAVATPPAVVPAVPVIGPDGLPVPPKRSPGHRGADVKDTVAEMAAKAHEISLEAGSKMAAAMKEVVSAAAGLTGFAIESARDLVQYMVRRGQMTQEEADKLIREAEDFQSKRKGPTPPKSSPASVAKAPSAKAPAAPAKTAAKKPAAPVKAAPAKKSAAKAPAKKSISVKPAAKKSSSAKAGSKSGKKK
jgi:predicted metal-binding protein